MHALLPQLKKAKRAATTVNNLPHNKRLQILRYLAQELRLQKKFILAANSKDVALYDSYDPMRDRLLLTTERIEEMAQGVESLISFPDPIGIEYDKRYRHGLMLHRQRVPFGVIGIIYESRPNVTTDMSAVCIKSGNVALLKGGKEAQHSYKALMRVIHAGLQKANVTKDAIQMIDPNQRELVNQLITAEQYVDLIIPRGGAGLIRYIRDTATVPTIETGAGVCHTFVDDTAKLKPSAQIIANAKTQRPSVCNALDTTLLHRKIYKKIIPLLSPLLEEKGVEIFADFLCYQELKKCYPAALLKKAKASDFGREFLSQRMSIKVVHSVHEAIKHINTYSSKHSEAILSQSKNNIKLFQSQIDAAVVYANASTRWSDGAQFGLGSEIGNSTQKLHARGPMSFAEMTTYKWLVTGSYTTRP